jgi:hypothetical protein
MKRKKDGFFDRDTQKRSEQGEGEKGREPYKGSRTRKTEFRMPIGSING